MKLAIYGDSFAEINHRNELNSWQHLLANKLNCSMDCFGENSSSVFYSYKKFLETHQNYDAVVFLVTEPHRYSKPLYIKNANEHVLVSTVYAIDYIKKNYKLTWEEKNYLDKMFNYFDVMDEEYQSTASELMLYKIENIHDRVIFYPCFSNSFNADRWKISGLDTKHCLFNFVVSGWKSFGFDEHFGVHRENIETTNSHMTPEYNLFLANVLYEKICFNRWNFKDFDNIKLTNPFNYYYR